MYRMLCERSNGKYRCYGFAILVTMTDALFLDLRDKPRVIDFLVENLSFVDSKDRKAAEEAIKTYQAGERVPTDSLAEIARKLALASWSDRCALKAYVEGEGAASEWEGVLAAVRPSTAHLVTRFRQKTKVATLTKLLQHPDVDSVLRDEEVQEILHIRSQVQQDIWKKQHKAVSAFIKEFDQDLEEYVKRMRALRDLAAVLPFMLQDEVFSKLKHYEDRIMFAGEEVSLEILDEEIKYYTDQKEISPLEN